MTDMVDQDAESGQARTNADDSVTDSNGFLPWTEICAIDDVVADRGVAALVATEDGTVPVAVFRLSAIDGGATEDEWLAVSHIDPASGAPTMARGLVGSTGEPPIVVPTVAAPLHKQRYNLRTGQCLDDDGLKLEVFEVDVIDDRVWVRPTT